MKMDLIMGELCKIFCLVYSSLTHSHTHPHVSSLDEDVKIKLRNSSLPPNLSPPSLKRTPHRRGSDPSFTPMRTVLSASDISRNASTFDLMKFKISHQGDLIIARIPPTCENVLKALIERVSLKLECEDVELYYRDEDDDLIRVHDDYDLKCAGGCVLVAKTMFQTNDLLDDYFK